MGYTTHKMTGLNAHNISLQKNMGMIIWKT